MEKKYEFTDGEMEFGGHTLHRIRALKSFDYVSAGDIGGWIESEDNLSQEGDCWVMGEAKVFGNARVYGDACIAGDACIYLNARVYGDALVDDTAQVYDRAQVHGNVVVVDNSRIYDIAEVYGGTDDEEEVVISGGAHICGKSKVNHSVSGGTVEEYPVVGVTKSGNGLKYKFANEKYYEPKTRVDEDGRVHTVRRIIALKSFRDVEKGTIGGWIEHEYNLSQEDDCWVYDNSSVYGDASVSGNAKITDGASVFGNAEVYGSAMVTGKGTRVYGEATVRDVATICYGANVHGDAFVCGNSIVGGTGKDISGGIFSGSEKERKKYELTNRTGIIDGHKLHRIRALKNFGNVERGAIGGWIESESNLSQEDDCWVYSNAMVFGNAVVSGDAQIRNTARVFENAKVYGNAIISGNARIHGMANICYDVSKGDITKSKEINKKRDDSEHDSDGNTIGDLIGKQIREKLVEEEPNTVNESVDIVRDVLGLYGPLAKLNEPVMSWINTKQLSIRESNEEMTRLENDLYVLGHGMIRSSRSSSILESTSVNTTMDEFMEAVEDAFQKEVDEQDSVEELGGGPATEDIVKIAGATILEKAKRVKLNYFDEITDDNVNEFKDLLEDEIAESDGENIVTITNVNVEDGRTIVKGRLINGSSFKIEL